MIMKKVFLLGDSINLHYGSYLLTFLQNHCQFSYKEGKEEALANINEPVGGNGGDSSMVLEYLRERSEKTDMDYDYLVFNAGLHDIKRNPPSMDLQVSPEDYRKNLLEIIKIMKNKNVKPVFITSTPVNDEIHHSYLVQNFGIERFNADIINCNNAAKEIMAENGIPVIDLYEFTLFFGKDAYIDHVHYSEKIRELQGAFLAGSMLQIIKNY